MSAFPFLAETCIPNPQSIGRNGEPVLGMADQQPQRRRVRVYRAYSWRPFSTTVPPLKARTH
jgi:hypothetical protein